LSAQAKLTRFITGPLGLLAATTLVVGGALAFPERSLADPPVFTSVPPNLLVEADAWGGATVDFTLPTATDDSGYAGVECDAYPGDHFDVGTTTVTCTASDPEADEQSEVSFSIRVLPHAQERSSSGDVKALLYYTKANDVLSPFKNVHVTIVRQGKVVRQAAVPYDFPAGFGTQRSIRVRDLDGDAEPEVLLDLYSGGAHCCFSSAIYRFSGASYERHNHFWGNRRYRIADLNRDRKQEFITADDRFAYAFSAFAFSGFPIQVWSYQGGSFSNVTRRYPALIRQDAVRQWRAYRSLRRHHLEVGGALAAWAANKYQLHEGRAALKKVAAIARSGGLANDYRPSAYPRRPKRFLGRLGYIR
jgi:HYR domain